MKLAREQVEHIAALARLSLNEEEKSLYQEQLSAILAHFARLQELDTEDISPTATILPLHNVMRSDDPRPSLPRADVLANAPAAENGCFRVAAVLE